MKQMMKKAAARMNGGGSAISGGASVGGVAKASTPKPSFAIPNDGDDMATMHMKMQMQAMMQMQEIQIEMKSKRADGEDLFDDGNLDGLRSMKALSRARAV